MRDLCLVGIGLNISFLIQSVYLDSGMGMMVSVLSMTSLGLAIYMNKIIKERDK
tara:strand:- start:69 stop:230 length:162 start_codon:yes stop_codon:yes gene_type:complete